MTLFSALASALLPIALAAITSVDWRRSESTAPSSSIACSTSCDRSLSGSPDDGTLSNSLIWSAGGFALALVRFSACVVIL